uniref:Uncharacterized protein n=1 Tax=Tetraselmis sp. GSL018 TaxID=582737 RepID=A0A061RHW2_9CHLO
MFAGNVVRGLPGYSVVLTSSSPSKRQIRQRTCVRVEAGKGFSKKAEEERKFREEARKPTKEQLEQNRASANYDEIVNKGGQVYAVFVRLKGDGPGPDGKHQWFPIGPMAVESANQVESALWNAEQPVMDATKKMYPQLYMKSVETGLEIGYRLRDLPQMTEAEIRAGGNPFANVIPLSPKDGETLRPRAKNPLAAAVSKFEQMFTSRGT